MSTRKLTVALPDGLLARLRDRARQANHSVEAEILDLLAAAVPADPTPSTDLTKATPAAGKRPRMRRTERADANGQRGGGEPTSAARPKATGPKDEEALPADIAAAVERIPSLNDRALRAAMKPLMTRRQAERLAALNYKAQDEGLTAAERAEQDELLHISDKSMLVRAAAMAELHKRGVDVAKLIYT
jgi:plasmid stability protein